MLAVVGLAAEAKLDVSNESRKRRKNGDPRLIEDVAARLPRVDERRRSTCGASLDGEVAGRPSRQRASSPLRRTALRISEAVRASTEIVEANAQIADRGTVAVCADVAHAFVTELGAPDLRALAGR